jgi:hypothetical protein
MTYEDFQVHLYRHAYPAADCGFCHPEIPVMRVVSTSFMTLGPDGWERSTAENWLRDDPWSMIETISLSPADA